MITFLNKVKGKHIIIRKKEAVKEMAMKTRKEQIIQTKCFDMRNKPVPHMIYNS